MATVQAKASINGPGMFTRIYAADDMAETIINHQENGRSDRKCRTAASRPGTVKE